MLIFALDAAGDHKTPILTVAGFASSACDWQMFSEQWISRLKQDDIEFFHAVDLAAFRGPFQHWRNRTDRAKLQQSLSADLMAILKRHVYTRVACTIVNKQFEHMDENLREAFSLCAYSLAGRTCEKHAREWVFRDNMPGKGAPVEIVFEAGDKGKGNLQK